MGQVIKQSGLCFGLAMLALGCVSSSASVVSGRFTVGGYVARESFRDSGNDSDSNDVATLSGRSYLHVEDMGEQHWDFVSDIRDKHDFFDKLDRERLQLTDRNSLQAQQFALRYPGHETYLTFGRFPIPEAGSAYADGAEVGRNWNADMRSALFAGFNPHRYDRAYLEFDGNAKVYGGYFVYQPKSVDWNHSLYSSQALVVEQVGHAVDRNYWFETTNYQWSERKRLYVLSYLDFVPRVNLQTGTVQLEEPLNGLWSAVINGLAIDTLEYERRQDLRERLAPSPYQEAGLSLRTHSTNGTDYVLSSSLGHRGADGLHRNEDTAGINWTGIFGPAWDAYSLAGYRHNFESEDLFVRAGGGYFSELWEFTLDAEAGQERYTDSTHKHPLSVQLGAARYLGSRLFAVVDFDYVRDETFTNTGAFFRLTYRFGSRVLAPVRDGAAPRGRL